jgi:hypothetical protein
MMAQKAKRQDYISNLSADLIAQALELIQEKSFPVYRKNIHQRNPPFAHGEFASAAVAIVLLTAGLDFHLARLKFFRDVAKTKPALPHTPYFNWNIGTYLYDKIDRLLYKRTEKRLKEQLIELTAMRDSVAHPKLYLVSSLLRHDATTSPETAKLVGGESHRAKTLKRKLKRSERTVSLRLPLVPSWISYVDIVLCVLVLTRFFNLLEERYGNFYSMLGTLPARDIPSGFFPNWRNTTRKFITLADWAQAFFNSLAAADQQIIRKRLGVDVSKYIRKRERRRKFKWPKTAEAIFRAAFRSASPPPPEFLRKAPPWKMVP